MKVPKTRVPERLDFNSVFTSSIDEVAASVLIRSTATIMLQLNDGADSAFGIVDHDI